MTILEQSAAYTQKGVHFLLHTSGDKCININYHPLHSHPFSLYESKSNIQSSSSGYFFRDSSRTNGIKFKPTVSHQLESFKDILPSDKERFRYEKPLKSLKEKIYRIYDENQEPNWDGYGAEPVKYLEQSLNFAEVLFKESRLLVESVEIVPENDGCLCFEWFKAENMLMNISVKENKLIYDYQIENNEGCGETSFDGYKKLLKNLMQLAS